MTEESTSGFTVPETGMMEQVKREGQQVPPFERVERKEEDTPTSEKKAEEEKLHVMSSEEIQAREEALGVPIEGVRMDDLPQDDSQTSEQDSSSVILKTAEPILQTPKQSISIGRIVSYRSRTGNYTVPAIVNCTTDSIYQPGVEAGFVPPLSSHNHVHLTVFTPGTPGMRTEAGTQPGAENFVVESPYPISENVAGCYQEWDIDYDENGGPGTWSWPSRMA